MGYLLKNYKSTYPGSNKVVYGPCETVQESQKKTIILLIFQNAISYFCKKKIASKNKNLNFFITLLCISKEAAWWVDYRAENQIEIF